MLFSLVEYHTVRYTLLGVDVICVGMHAFRLVFWNLTEGFSAIF